MHAHHPPLSIDECFPTNPRSSTRSSAASYHSCVIRSTPLPPSPPVPNDDTKHRSESDLVVPLRFSVFSFATVVRLQGLDRRGMGPNVQQEKNDVSSSCIHNHTQSEFVGSISSMNKTEEPRNDMGFRPFLCSTDLSFARNVAVSRFCLSLRPSWGCLFPTPPGSSMQGHLRHA